MTNEDLKDMRQILDAALRTAEMGSSPRYQSAQATIWSLLEGLRQIMQERDCLE